MNFVKCELCSSPPTIVERFVVARASEHRYTVQIVRACSFCRFAVKLRRALERR